MYAENSSVELTAAPVWVHAKLEDYSGNFLHIRKLKNLITNYQKLIELKHFLNGPT